MSSEEAAAAAEQAPVPVEATPVEGTPVAPAPVAPVVAAPVVAAPVAAAPAVKPAAPSSPSEDIFADDEEEVEWENPDWECWMDGDLEGRKETLNWQKDNGFIRSPAKKPDALVVDQVTVTS